MFIFFIIFAVSFIISIIWVSGIDHMQTKYPDYKGEDFLQLKEENENNIHK